MAILTYHHIGPMPVSQTEHRGLWVTEETFARQLAWLKERNYKPVTLDEIDQHLAGIASLPRRWVAITFDDGWRDNFTLAMPRLIEVGFPAAVFIVTSKIRETKSKDAWGEYLSADEILQMRDAGFSIGSHTVNHPKLTRLSDDEARIEIEQSRKDLAQILGRPPSWFCYPYGNTSPRIAGLVREAGYAGALGTIRDNLIRPGQRFWLPRVMVMHDTEPEKLGYMLSRTYHWVHAWKNRSRWNSLKSVRRSSAE